MININLLSPEDKEDIKWEKTNRLIALDAAAVVVAQLVFLLSLLASIEYLKIENGNLDSQLVAMQSAAEAKEARDIKKNVENYESWLKQVTQIQKDHIYWSRLFEEFSGLVPDGIKIMDFNVQSEESGSKAKSGDKKKEKSPDSRNKKYILNITGKAVNRNDLLRFESSLKKSDIFSDLETFEINYIKETDIDFKYKVNINGDKIISLN